MMSVAAVVQSPEAACGLDVRVGGQHRHRLRVHELDECVRQLDLRADNLVDLVAPDRLSAIGTSRPKLRTAAVKIASVQPARGNSARTPTSSASRSVKIDSERW